MDVDIAKIRELAALAREEKLAELSVSDGPQSVTIKVVADPSTALTIVPPAPVAAYGPPVLPAAPPAASPPPAAAPAAPASESRYTPITSPMVGTFYGSPSPDADAFVSVGQRVSVGQKLCIIEAMKMMNELESDVTGVIVSIEAVNGQPVEFGQTLMLIDPA
ncbi:MAG: acetyl-CoA carboxylase biotin carboxyl carrier protein [Vampirovibrionales bacterium]|nr:acetyl-CoA carboxylase biotin carboxyl carrier protein [Vampirovibrionales bacterium]